MKSVELVGVSWFKYVLDPIVHSQYGIGVSRLICDLIPLKLAIRL